MFFQHVHVVRPPIRFTYSRRGGRVMGQVAIRRKLVTVFVVPCMMRRESRGYLRMVRRGNLFFRL